MKKRTIISLLLVACMATMCFVGGTFAKYVSSTSGSDSVRVASFNVQFDGERITSESFVHEFNLFDTIKDTDGEEEGDVAEGRIIAPGTSGAFDFAVKSESEVTVAYVITIQETEAGVPLQWSVDGEEWVDSIAALNLTLSDTIAIGDTTEKPIAIQWKWAFDNEVDTMAAGQTDITDTALGVADPLAQPSVAISVTFTQVD